MRIHAVETFVMKVLLQDVTVFGDDDDDCDDDDDDCDGDGDDDDESFADISTKSKR